MSFYDSTVPAFLHTLGNLTGLLGKAEAHCQSKNIQPEVLLGARLYPDMLPFSSQIQNACDAAAKGCARVTHSEVPSIPHTEKTFDELRQRVANTIEYVRSFKPAQFEGADAKDVTLSIGPNSTTMKGQQLISNIAFPNFFFHVIIAYGLLRHNGVDVGKRDFLGLR